MLLKGVYGKRIAKKLLQTVGVEYSASLRYRYFRFLITLVTSSDTGWINEIVSIVRAISKHEKLKFSESLALFGASRTTALKN